MSFTSAWDETKPAGSRNLNLGDDDIREFKQQVRERADVDSYFPSTDSAQTGYHRKSTYAAQGSDPSAVSAALIAYAKTVSGAAELFVQHESAGVVQLTRLGKIWASALGIASEAQGDILFRGASIWDRLGAGTNGQFLKTQGAAANPIWADALTTLTPANALSGSAIKYSNYQRSDAVTCATNVPGNNSSRTSAEGNQILTVAHTPANASNILKIEVLVQGNASQAGDVCAILMNGTTVLATGRAHMSAAAENLTDPICITLFMVAGTTSPITFNVNAGIETGTFYLNSYNNSPVDNGKCYSSITVTEIKA